MTTPTYDVPAKRAGFADALVGNLFPNLRKTNAKAFASDVQFIYDWEASSPRYSINDPLGLKGSGDYGSPHAAMVATEHYLQSVQQKSVLDALRKGDTSTAKKAEAKISAVPIKHATIPGAHISSKTGDWTTAGGPGTLSQIGSTLADLPGATVSDVKNAPGSIGSLLGKNMVLVVLVVALILVMKK